MSNPLLDFGGLPRFDAIRPEHISPAIDLLVAHARATADAIATDSRPATWDSVVAPQDDALDRIERAWGAVHHLNSVVSTPALRDAYHENLPKITAFYAYQAQDERLYARYKALAASPAFAATKPPGESSSTTSSATSGWAAPICRPRKRLD
jgi:oligopeptidase A